MLSAMAQQEAAPAPAHRIQDVSFDQSVPSLIQNETTENLLYVELRFCGQDEFRFSSVEPQCFDFGY